MKRTCEDTAPSCWDTLKTELFLVTQFLYWGRVGNVLLLTCNLKCFERKKGIKSWDGVNSINVTQCLVHRSVTWAAVTSCVSSALGFYCKRRLCTKVNEGTKTWTQNISETEAPPEVWVLSETQGLLVSCCLCSQDINSTIFVNAWRFRWGNERLLNTNWCLMHSPNFTFMLFMWLSSWFTATEEVWFVNFRITTADMNSIFRLSSNELLLA